MDNTGPAGLDTIKHGVEAVVLANEPLRILDLPNELIGKIMFHLSKRADVRNGGDVAVGVSSTQTQDIKNVRLSCHILSAAASRYLIDRLTVYVSRNSLSRLEEISEHPLICHSVQVVEVCLAQYDNVFGNSIRGFIHFINEHVGGLAIRYRSSSEMRQKALDVTDSWNGCVEILQANAGTFFGSFDEEIESILDFTWDIRHIGGLLEGFCQYRSRLNEQASLQQDGFVARVSAAMAKLTGVTHLKITDWDTAAWGRQPGRVQPNVYGLDLSTDSSIAKSLAASRRSFEYVQGTKLLSMVPALVCAGKGIKSLDIQISPLVWSYTELAFSNPQEAELRSGLKGLQSFKFENYRTMIANPWNEALAAQHLGQFIDACLISDKLESLFIKPKIRHPRSTTSLFSPRPWPQLKSAVLEGLPASAADLDVLAKSLASEPVGSLDLRSVHLYCGATWASVLDMLRNRRILTSLGMHQSGAEFETDPALCDEVFRHNQWSFTISLPSFAEYYIQGEEMANPLLELPDEELRESLFGPVLDYWTHGGVGYDFEGFE